MTNSPRLEGGLYGKFADHGEEQRHSKAVISVMKFFFLFMIMDMLVIATYGQSVWIASKVAGNPGVGEILDGMVVLCFSMDVILAVALLWSFNRQGDDLRPQDRWQENYNVISINLTSNVCSVLVLACQRFYNAQGHQSLMIIAFVYIVVRVAKLHPISQLKRDVAYASSHADVEGPYEGLLKVWATEKKDTINAGMKRMTFGAIAVIVITLVAASLQDHLSSGGSINMGLSSAASSGIPSEQIAPARSSPHPVFLADHFEDSAAGAVGGAAIGGGYSAIMGPEAAPAGAAIGGAIGAVAGLLFR